MFVISNNTELKKKCIVMEHYFHKEQKNILLFKQNIKSKIQKYFEKYELINCIKLDAFI